MAFGPTDAAVTRTASIEERVVEVTLRRVDGKEGAELDVVVTVTRGGKRLQKRLSDEDVTTLWNAVTTRSFKNWILQQVIPNAR